MTLRDQPIQRKLTIVILLTSIAVLLLTCAAFVAYEVITFRRGLAENLTTLAQITAENSTAALAFENQTDAEVVLSALRIERNLVAAGLYNKDGELFATYPTHQPARAFPSKPEKDGHRFGQSHLLLFQPVIEDEKRLGTLYLKADVSAMYERFRLYGGIVVLVMAISCLVAFAMSSVLQKSISQPILDLAETAKAIAERKDYSVRARKMGPDELGLLTDAFNQMLDHVHERDSALRKSEARKGAILESAVDGIISIDNQGCILEFNPAAQRMFGYSRDQVIGKEMAALIVPLSLRDKQRRGLAHYLATGEGTVLGQRLELSALRAEGEEFPVELSITRIGTEEPATFTGFVRDISERKRVEALRAHFAAIVESSTDAIIGKTLEGLITSWNPGAEKLFGYTAQEVLGKSMFLLVPPERSAEEVDILTRIARGERISHFETVRLRKDGSRTDVSETISPIWDSTGNIIGASKIARDITERKQAEAELQRLAQFPEQNPSPVLRMSDDGALLYANSSARWFLAELGWKSDGVLPDVLQEVAIEARRQACRIEREICCPHGQIIWFTAVSFGDDHYVNIYGRDITERKQAEERFRILVEAAPNAMVMVDPAGTIELVNVQVEKLFGYSRDELLGQSVEFLVPERFRAAHPGHRARFFAEPSARAMGAGRDLYGLGKDGREIPIEIGLNPIRINERPFVLASIIDITERKRVEQMLRDLNVELERRVAARTAELEVEVTERRQAEEVMRAALEEKKTLLEEIHHRVKNNLQIISSLLRLQGDYVKNEEDRAMFAECQNRVRTMSMVHERLYRSQNLASINFGEHVRDLANMLASTYSQAAVQVQVFPEAEGIPLQLETAIPAGLIVNELVSNALKHAFPDGRRGTLKVSLHSPAPGQLLLSVEDDGVGLPPGFDWDQARSLGLRMVHDLARQIRGTLEVRQHGGTSFALSFPVAKPQPVPSPQP